MNSANEQGFTLLEVVIAMAILSIGILAMYSMQITGMQGNATANRITAEATWAGDRVERMVAMGYVAGGLVDTDSDGTDKDKNFDGVDDTGNNFGLDDLGTDADGSDTTPDGKYNVFWNVAHDIPVKNAKKIRVFVQTTYDGKLVQLDYIKTDPL